MSAPGADVLLLGWYAPGLDALTALGCRVVNVIAAESLPKARAHGSDAALVVVPDSDLAEDVVSGLARHHLALRDFTAVCTLREFPLVAAGLLADLAGAAGLGHRTAVALRDKFVQKELVRAAGLPVTPCRVVDSLSDLAGCDVALPLVVKPLAGGGTRDTHLLADAADVKRLVADGPGGHGPWLVEDFVDGTELHLDGVVRGGVVRDLGVSRYLQNLIGIKSGGPVGSVVLEPGRHGTLHADALRLVSGVLAALGHQDGIFHIEVFEKDGELTFSECGGRVGGGMVLETTAHRFGVDLADAWARAVLGLPYVAGSGGSGRPCGWIHLPAPAGLVTRAPGKAEVLARPGCVRAVVSVAEGTRMQDVSVASNLKAGKAVVEGDTEEEVARRLKDLAAWFLSCVRTTAPGSGG